MRYFVTNKTENGLGKPIEAESPEEAVKKARLTGTCTVRWNVKWGGPGKPGKEGGEWWFANSTSVGGIPPKAEPKPPEPGPAPEPFAVAVPKASSSQTPKAKDKPTPPRGAAKAAKP